MCPLCRVAGRGSKPTDGRNKLMRRPSVCLPVPDLVTSFERTKHTEKATSLFRRVGKHDAPRTVTNKRREEHRVPITTDLRPIAHTTPLRSTRPSFLSRVPRATITSTVHLATYTHTSTALGVLQTVEREWGYLRRREKHHNDTRTNERTNQRRCVPGP